MNNDEYVYVIFRTEYTMVDYDIDKLYLEKIVKLEDEAKEYIKQNNKKDKYTGFNYKKIKIGEFCYMYLDANRNDI
jgi:hypothetical protein